MEKPPVFKSTIKAPELFNKANKLIMAKMHLGWKWSRLRRNYMCLHPFCERCGLMGEVVHHIIPRAKAPHLTYEWSNLMTLCNDCHNKEHGMGGWNEWNGIEEKDQDEWDEEVRKHEIYLESLKKGKKK